MNANEKLHIRISQRAWADHPDQKIEYDDDGYCLDPRQNLFQELTSCTRRELEEGDGAEIGKNGQRGKLQALHSSSALVCNVFDYWRGRELALIADALGIKGRVCGMSFEKKFSTGVGTKSPNLDLVLSLSAGGYFAIESKFTEPLSKSKNHSRLKDKYFDGNIKRWTKRGLPRAQRLADDLRAGRIKFDYLDAAQLLKHMLGLAGTGTQWHLSYLWFDTGATISGLHQKEIALFSESLGPDRGHFSSTSYQVFFQRLSSLVGSNHVGYLSYLRSRYFANA